jgi:hypothetical protein
MESKGVFVTTAVTVSAFYTRNLGNFENAKVGYEITSDDIRPGETVDEFRDRLKAKVQNWVSEDIQEIDRDAAASKG